MKHRILAALSICSLIFASSCESNNGNNDNPFPDIQDPSFDDDNDNENNESDDNNDGNLGEEENPEIDNPNEDEAGEDENNPNEDETDDEKPETPVEDNDFVFRGTSFTNDEEEYYKAIFDEFKSEYPEYSDLNFVYVPFGYVTDDFNFMMENEEPDVYLTTYNGIREQAVKNQVNKVQAKYVDGITENNTELSIEGSSYEGNYYGYPFSLNSGYIFYYDKSVVTDYDENTTFDQIISQCAKHNKKFVYPMGDSWYLYGAFAGFGGSIKADYKENSEQLNIECNFDEKPGLDAGNFLIDLANNENYQYVDGGACGDSSVRLYEYFTSHLDEVGAFIGHAGILNDLQGYDNPYYDPSIPPWEQDTSETIDFDSESERFESGILPLMEAEDGTKSRMKTFAEGISASVYQKSDKKDCAHAFANYITSEEVQLKNYEYYDIYYPTNNNVRNLEVVLDNQDFVAFDKQCENSAVLQVNIPIGFWQAMQNFGVEIGYTNRVNKDNLEASLEYTVNQIKYQSQ